MSQVGRSRTEQDFITLLRMVHNLSYKLFIFEIFHLIFSDHTGCWVSETAEIETKDKGGLQYSTVSQCTCTFVLFLSQITTWLHCTVLSCINGEDWII